MHTKTNSKLALLLKAFCVFFLISFGGGVLAYSLLARISKVILGQPYVFGALYRMFTYHWEHPFQYIAVATIHYSLFASMWVTFWSNASGWRRWVQISLVLIASLLTSGIWGGVLWKYHDMRAGFFPEGGRMLSDILWGASTGFVVGPIIVLLSFPLNAMALIAGYFFTHKVPLVLKSRKG
jgi:hypothetical protein